MNNKKYKTFVWKQTDQTSTALDLYLVQKLQEDAYIEVSRKVCKSSIENGEISVFINNKKAFKSSSKVGFQDNIKANVSINFLKQHSSEEIKNKVELKDSDILWEDRWLLIARKPKGIPSLQTLDPKRDYFLAAVKRLLIKRGERDPYLVLHHRLDVETSGVMLFCKKKSLNKKVGELFSQRKIQKTYHALCQYEEGHQFPNGPWEVKNYLKKSDGRPLKMSVVEKGGDFAHTHFKIIKKDEQTVLIEAKPHTGRTHQIRVHLSHIRLPIVNDPLYGSLKDNSLLQLRAISLEFTHPESGNSIKVIDNLNLV